MHQVILLPKHIPDHVKHDLAYNNLEYNKARVHGYNGIRSVSLERRCHTSEYITSELVVNYVRGVLQHTAEQLSINILPDYNNQINCLKYRSGDAGNFATHTDTIFDSDIVRKLTMIVMLEPAKSGGELVINGNDINLDAGDVVVFPSIYPHEVKPVTQGTRYTMVAWAYGPCWQ